MTSESSNPTSASEHASPWFEELIRCPECGAVPVLLPRPHCTHCGFHAPSERDLRLTRAQIRQLPLSTIPPVPASAQLDLIDTSRPGIEYSGPMAQRDSRELMTEIAARLPAGGRALDLGCGPGDQTGCLAYLGFESVGVDYAGPAADLLADAHGLPFADASFDLVFSYAVLEHLHTPQLALTEIARVLRPGGWYIATVSQGEPFHASYFHHTAWGVASLIGSHPQLELMRLWAAGDTLDALVAMGQYPRVIRHLMAGVQFLHFRLPWLAPRRRRLGAKARQLDDLWRAAAICFSVRKRPLATDSMEGKARSGDSSVEKKA